MPPIRTRDAESLKEAHFIVSTITPVKPRPAPKTAPAAPGVAGAAEPLVYPVGSLSSRRVTLVIGITLFVALAFYYFVGVDEGMTSVFGHTMVVHEWVHDSRHFLGFPCH